MLPDRRPPMADGFANALGFDELESFIRLQWLNPRKRGRLCLPARSKVEHLPPRPLVLIILQL